MATGRASPMLPMAAGPAMNTYEMSTMSNSPFLQQGMAMPDPRTSVAYSSVLPGSPVLPMSPGYADALQSSYIEMTPGVTATFGATSPPAHQWPSGVSDGQLAGRVSEIIATTDLMSITKKQVRQNLMAQFGLSPDEEKARRDFINQRIAYELEIRQSGQ
ncbi:hypothetical protein GGI21_004929 [Coemansia aciculifera]|nr:hypothetical protein GGI21_004929 [Coemansia aciculifera]